ncbi:hypothetical protein EV426DRAFT_571073 [Tirmania nivea]|nr:hypothetical protein EV426DRAFT_571073 [Tirmania nivea]
MPPKKAQGAYKNFTSKPPSSVQSKRKAALPAKPNRKPELDSTAAQSEQEILTIFRRAFSHALTDSLPQKSKGIYTTEIIQKRLVRKSIYRLVCIGGGAGAEVVGIAAVVKELTERSGGRHEGEETKALEQRSEQVGETEAPGEVDNYLECNQEQNKSIRPSLSRLHVTATI